LPHRAHPLLIILSKQSAGLGLVQSLPSPHHRLGGLRLHQISRQSRTYLRRPLNPTPENDSNEILTQVMGLT